MLPLVGISSPAIMRINVVLPQPEGPSRHVTVPSAKTAVMSSTALNLSKARERWLNRMSGIQAPLPAPNQRPAGAIEYQQPLAAHDKWKRRINVEMRHARRGHRSYQGLSASLEIHDA